METRAVAKAETAAPAVQWSRDEVETIRRTVADKATPEELKMFLHLASAYGLDPFARDIWFVKMGEGSREKPLIMTSRDGYLKIANRDPHFEGMDADVVYSGDSFRKTPGGVEHVYGAKDRGAPIGAYAIVYRDDRKIPVYAYAPFKDYGGRTSVWRQYPHAMILKVAEAMALKRAFSISGLVTREEMEDGSEPAPVMSSSKKPNSSSQGKRAAELWRRYVSACGGNESLAKVEMQRVAPTPSRTWTEDDFARLMEHLDEISSPEEDDEPMDAEVVENAEAPQEAPEQDEDAQLRTRAAELFDLLDWQPAEQAQWLYGVTKKYTELKDITAGPLAKVVGALEREVKKLDERQG